MGLDELSNIFMKISAKKGSKYADQAIQNQKAEKIKEYLLRIIEFLSVNLQAEYNRIISCSALGQLSTQDIGNNLKDIIEEHIDKAIYLIEKERDSDPEKIGNIVPNILIQLNTKINEKENTKKALIRIFELNLLHDFGNIVDSLCEFDVHNVDLLLRYLVVLNIQRRMSRRQFLNR